MDQSDGSDIAAVCPADWPSRAPGWERGLLPGNVGVG